MLSNTLLFPKGPPLGRDFSTKNQCGSESCSLNNRSSAQCPQGVTMVPYLSPALSHEAACHFQVSKVAKDTSSRKNNYKTAKTFSCISDSSVHGTDLSARSSLTREENNFLTWLAVDGDETQLKSAISKLSDKNLIFEPKDDTSVQKQESEREGTENENKLTQSGRNESGKSQGKNRRGFAKKLSLRHLRRACDDHSNLWIAGGYFFPPRNSIQSRASSRRNSIQSRRNSPLFSSATLLSDNIDYQIEKKVSFRILGTGGDDESVTSPHILSPALMESLRSFLPSSVAEHNFWLKFSLVRDGASLQTLMQNVRAARHTILAIETVDGEILGSFTSTVWRKQPNYFGSGESFLWKLRLSDNTQLESSVDVYPWTGKNYCVQNCSNHRIALGGDEIDSEFGITLDEDLLMGSSHACATFDNPMLVSDGDNGAFEVANIEVWALTPCINEEEAEKFEFSKMFFEGARRNSAPLHFIPGSL